MTEVCGDCQHYTREPIGAYSLGECLENVQRNNIAIVYHKKQIQFHYQDVLLYPGQKACGKWIAK